MLLALRRSHDNGDWKKFSISWREALSVGAKKMTKTRRDHGEHSRMSGQTLLSLLKVRSGLGSGSAETVPTQLEHSVWTLRHQPSKTAQLPPSSLPVPNTAPCACRHNHVSWWCLHKFFGDPEVSLHLYTLHSILKNQPETERKENETHLSLQCLVTLCALLYLHLKIL